MQFSNWTEEDLLGAIRSLEEAIAGGVASASYPGGGNINYTSQANMRSTLVELRGALKMLTTGKPPVRIRRVIHSARKGL